MTNTVLGPKLSAQRSGEWTGLRGFLRRRQFLVYKHLQLGLLFFALGEVLFFAFVVGAALFLPPAAHVWTEAADSRGAIDAATQLLQLHSSFWPAAGLALIAITLHSIFATHRVAGPIYRFRRLVRAMEQGVFPKPGTLRKGDYLQGEMDAFNAMLEANRSRILELREAREQLRSALTRLESSEPGLEDPELRRRIEDVAREGKRVDDAAAAFVIES